MYEQLLQLDTLKISFNQTGTRILGLFLAFVMYGVALGLKPQFFKGVFNKPSALFIGLLSQWLFLPSVTFLLLMLTKDLIPPMVAMGLILVASCPGGTVSNFMTSYAKGNAELSVSMSTITTLGAPIFTPINFAFWGGLYTKYLHSSAGSALMTLQIPLIQVFTTVVLIIGIPVVLGLITAKYAPVAVGKMKGVIRYFSIAMFIAIVAIMLSSNFDLFKQFIGLVFIIVFFHNLVAFIIGFVSSKIGGLSVRDRRAVTIEVGIQNSGLGLLLLFNPHIFSPDLANGGMVFVTAWWGLWHIISGLLLATGFRFFKFDTSDLLKRRKG